MEVVVPPSSPRVVEVVSGHERTSSPVVEVLVPPGTVEVVTGPEQNPPPVVVEVVVPPGPDCSSVHVQPL